MQGKLFGEQMRYAIVSDIHGNLSAWNTVLADIALRRVDRIICLGDVVGYGPEPAEVLKSVYEHVHLMVLGNHDAVVAERMSADTFNDRARRMITWTQEQLGTKAREFFGALPLVLKGDNFRCVHGDFSDPAVFNYVETPEEAKASFDAVPEQLLFCGHSHEAGIFVVGAKGIPHALAPQDFTLEPSKRYIVNVGSVGYARSGDPRAFYVVFDEEEGSILFFKLSYDFEAFRAAAARKQLGPDEIPLLRRSPTGALESVRETLDFAPDASARVLGKVVESDVTTLLKKRTLLWKGLAIAAITAGLLVAATSVFFVLQAGVKSVAFPPERVAPLTTAAHVWPDGNLLPPLFAHTQGGFSSSPFRLVLGDSRNQSIEVAKLDVTRTCILVSSTTPAADVIFESPEIACRAGDRFEVISKVLFADDFKGELSMTVKVVNEVAGKARSERVVMTKSFANTVGLRDENLPVALRGLPNAEGWWIARGTSDGIPAGGVLIRVELSGRFTGIVKIGGIAVRRK